MNTSILEKICERIKESPDVDNRLLDFIISDTPKYLYGNGPQTAVCLEIFRDMKVEIKGILLPPGTEKQRLKGYWGELLRKTDAVSAQNTKKTERHNLEILLTVSRDAYEISRQLLTCLGYKKIYECCWKHNQVLKHVCFDAYQEEEKRWRRKK